MSAHFLLAQKMCWAGWREGSCEFGALANGFAAEMRVGYKGAQSLRAWGNFFGGMVMTVFDFLYPPRCPVCNHVRLPWEEVCCPACRKTLKAVGEDTCYFCGRQVAEQEEYCSRCQKKRPVYERGFSVFLYEGTLRESLMGFKFRGREWNGRFYAEEILRCHKKELAAFGAEAVVPVPVHRRKMRKRGYNQAEIIARYIAKELRLPCRSRLLVRKRYTTPQKELGETERLQNLLDAFAVSDAPREKKRMTPKSVILVDDILTTGSTLEVCGRILKRAGVERIAAVTVCTGSGY